MRTIFADTGYWIALLNPRDELHETAKKLSVSLSSAYLITSEMVLTEVLNDFSKRGNYFRKAGVRLVEGLELHPNITIISQDRQRFKEGLELYKNRSDKSWSLTDCVSFNIMKQFGITEALAHDKHFEQAGFLALLR
ncbi:nucleic acid-binding protein [Aphanothece hegewaldii CCALA 016]|uniref:Nucleic acid-binding protein n=1 Tax=Aphanothece hegewaldii CCALA 016 TaxID=2107694 RepID=A0A2T1LWU1_9CHRO|nr:PIN domain-containing protein [Aphanothece hegewaldii]PSF36623.1 nucleic acid-binding protein [Aphanothece hegewaldii CCALA 016]